MGNVPGILRGIEEVVIIRTIELGSCIVKRENEDLVNHLLEARCKYEKASLVTFKKTPTFCCWRADCAKN